MQQPDSIKFIRKFLIFIIVLFVCDRIIGYGLQTLYFSLKKGQYAQTSYAIETASPDLVVFGSSRALHHYASPELAEQLHCSVYNAGRDGQFIPYYCALEDVMLNRRKPKAIILDVNVWELAPNNEKYEKLAMLLPYIPRHPELKKYTNEISKWEYLKLYCKTYPYNSTLLISVHDYLFANKLPQDENGYFPLERTMNRWDFESYRKKKLVYDEKRARQHIPVDQKAVKY